MTLKPTIDLERAKKWLEDPDGSDQLKKEIMETLLVHLQIEAREGMIEGADDKERAASRQSRKQHKEMSELVLSLVSSRDKK